MEQVCQAGVPLLIGSRTSGSAAGGGYEDDEWTEQPPTESEMKSRPLCSAVPAPGWMEGELE